MHSISNRDDAKKLASALRKSIKAFDASSALSHSHACEALAQALGYKNWSTLCAALPESAPAVAAPAAESVEPLSNAKGLFDFGKEGRLVHGLTFCDVDGTVEDIPGCVGQVSTVLGRTLNGLDIDWEGSTDVNWDGQVTRTDERGVALWWADGEAVPEDQLLVVPDNFDASELEDYPVRKPLLEAFIQHLRTQGLLGRAEEQAERGDAAALKKMLDTAQDTLRFALTPQEEQALIEWLSLSSGR